MSEAPADPGNNPPATPPADGAVPPATPPADSGSLLNTPPADGENIQTAEGEWLLSSQIKGTGDAPAWFKADKYKTVEAQAEAYVGLESKLGGFTGAPDEYALNGPENFEFNNEDPLISGAMEMAKEMGMSQDGFDKLIDLWISNTTENAEEVETARVAEIADVLGQNHAQRISQVSGALSNMLDAETLKEISPYANTPQAIRLVEAVILATAAKVPPINGGANPQGFTKQGLDKMRDERLTDGPHKGELRFHKDPAFRKEIENYSKSLHGEE